MTLGQLRALVAVAASGSVRAASERLLVSQPAVSGSIASIEKELGVELVRREGRGLRFTPAGLAFVAAARESLAALERGVLETKSIEAPGKGAVRIAAVTTAAERLLPRLLAALKRALPAVQVTLQVGNRTDVWEWLSNGVSDLVVAGRPPLALKARTLGRAANRLVLVGAGPDAATGRDARLAAGPADADAPGGSARLTARPGLSALAAETWLLREEGSGTRQATEDLLAQLGIDPPRMILGSNGAVEQAASAGLGVAFVSHHAVRGALAAGRLSIYQCPGTPFERPWHLVAPGGAPSPTVALAATLMLSEPDGFAVSPGGRRLFRESAPLITTYLPSLHLDEMMY